MARRHATALVPVFVDDRLIVDVLCDLVEAELRDGDEVWTRRLARRHWSLVTVARSMSMPSRRVLLRELADRGLVRRRWDLPGVGRDGVRLGGSLVFAGVTPGGHQLAKLNRPTRAPSGSVPSER